MTTKTLKWVDPATRQWDSQYGPMVSITVEFEDGIKGQVNTKPESLAKRLAELEACIGQPGEFTVEDNGKWPDGNPKPVKVKEWPGKPQQQGPGGGGKSYGLSVAERLELDRFKEASTNARTAVMQAVTLTLAQGEGEWIIVAARIYDWLQQQAGAGAAPSVSAPPSGEEAHTKQEAPAQGSAATVGDPPSASPETVRAGEGDGEGSRSGLATCLHSTWADPPNPDAARRGIKVCVDCGHAEKRAA